jgi:hypothetical protein
MTFHNGYNLPHGAGTDEIGSVPGFDKDKPDTGEQYLRHISQGALAGVAYGIWAIADIYIPAMIEPDSAAPHVEAVFRALLVGIPTTLLFFRRGMFSALSLTALTALNGASLWIAYKTDDPDMGALSFIPHIPFFVLFARAAWAARVLRKQ